MIRFLIITAVLLLIIGPLRRRLLSASRFIIPAVLGGVIGFIAAAVFVGTGAAPGWLIIIFPFISACMIGSAGKKWIDENFGPKGG